MAKAPLPVNLRGTRKSIPEAMTSESARVYVAPMDPRMVLPRHLGGIRPLLADSMFAVCLTLVTCLVASQYQPDGWKHADALAYALSCLVCLPLAARRTAPVAALLLSTAASVSYLVGGYPPSLNWWGPVLAFYSVIVYRPWRVAIAGTVLTAGVVLLSGLKAPELPLSVVVVQPIIIVAAAWLFGVGARRLAERNEQLGVLTAQLHREQQDRARRAVTDERVRIARELHDVVAHHMSVVSVQVGLAQYVFASDQATAQAALDTIADAAREAQQEMRRLLVVLRVGAGDDTDADRADAVLPGLAQFDELIDRVRVAGLPVEVVFTGTVSPLPAHVDLCVYRVIRESLTNALKHAGPAQATVTLRYQPGTITAAVSDNGLGMSAKIGDHLSGQGLIGMRERARLYGGTLSAGPRPQGGYEVVLTLPTHPDND